MATENSTQSSQNQPEMRIKVHDRHFVPYLNRERIQEIVCELAQRLNEAYAEKDVLIVSVLKGAFMFTADLMREVKFDPEVQFIRVSSYGGGMTSSGNIRQTMGLEVPVEGRHVLLVEDIVDTGLTLDWLRAHLWEKNAASVSIATLLFKKEAFQGSHLPEFVGTEIPNKFVVGYGLDYAELGRSLEAIWQAE